jgi:hypothetical protein
MHLENAFAPEHVWVFDDGSSSKQVEEIQEIYVNYVRYFEAKEGGQDEVRFEASLNFVDFIYFYLLCSENFEPILLPFNMHDSLSVIRGEGIWDGWLILTRNLPLLLLCAQQESESESEGSDSDDDEPKIKEKRKRFVFSSAMFFFFLSK